MSVFGMFLGGVHVLNCQCKEKAEALLEQCANAEIQAKVLLCNPNHIQQKNSNDWSWRDDRWESHLAEEASSRCGKRKKPFAAGARKGEMTQELVKAQGALIATQQAVNAAAGADSTIRAT